MGSCRVHVDLTGGPDEEQWTRVALGWRAGQLNVACVNVGAWRRYYGGMTFGGVGWGLRITLSLDIGVGGGEEKESVSVSGGCC